jgi:hypothetical protein
VPIGLDELGLLAAMVVGLVLLVRQAARRFGL